MAAGWLDLPFADLAVVLEEAGAALLCAPLLGTAVGRGPWPVAAPSLAVGSVPPWPWPRTPAGGTRRR